VVPGAAPGIAFIESSDAEPVTLERGSGYDGTLAVLRSSAARTPATVRVEPWLLRKVNAAIFGREDVDESFGPASVVLRGYGRRVGAGTWSDLLSGLTPRLGCLVTGPSPGSRSFRQLPALPVRSAWPGQEAGVSQIGGQRVRAIPQTTEKGRQ